eukprot:365299-Chlamydomonas_euryale.AAC.6
MCIGRDSRHVHTPTHPHTHTHTQPQTQQTQATTTGPPTHPTPHPACTLVMLRTSRRADRDEQPDQGGRPATAVVAAAGDPSNGALVQHLLVHVHDAGAAQCGPGPV